MRILFFSYAYPNPWQPELATFNRTMIAGLAQDHDVCVISPIGFVARWRRWRCGLDRHADFVAVPGVPAEYPTYYYTPKICRAHYHRFMAWSVGGNLRRAIHAFRPDVVLSYWAHPDGAVAVRFAHAGGVPAVQIVGGSDVLLLARDPRRRAVIFDVLHRADAVIAVSSDIAATLAKAGLDTHKLHVVRRGIDRQVFHAGDQKLARQRLGLPEDRPVLLGVGRLVPVKGWPDWLLAARMLVDRGLRPACYVLGEGPLDGELKRLMREYGLERIVEFRGPQPQTELARWYRAADVTVLASHSEGVPNVLLETIACGGSFVATAVGGIPEIADLRCDRLAPARQPAALADAIAHRLAHPPPPDYVRRWMPASLEQAAADIGAVLESVCAAPTLAFPRKLPALNEPVGTAAS
jgi:glycosyltransferase involved in cell wall biosynthesis